VWVREGGIILVKLRDRTDAGIKSVQNYEKNLASVLEVSPLVHEQPEDATQAAREPIHK